MTERREPTVVVDEPLLVDYETVGRLDLTKVGGFLYATDVATRVLMVGVATPKGIPVVRDSLRDIRNRRMVSWGDFDRLIYRHSDAPGPDRQRLGPYHRHVDRVHDTWIDAMALARYSGFPGGLSQFAAAMGIPVTKDPAGKKLIRKYSMPDPKTGDFLELSGHDRRAFEAYCLQDLVVLQAAWGKLSTLFPEWEELCSPAYEATLRMNAYGVPIDREAAANALEMCRKQEIELTEECEKLCGLRPTQAIALAEYLGLPNAQKATLEAATFDDPVKQRVAEIRLTAAKAATKKLVPMLEMSALTGRAHGCFVFNGAHTGRGSSRGIQLQNMVRAKVDEETMVAFAEGLPVADPLNAVRKNIRGFIRAPEGMAFVACDYSQIEARLVAWLAGCPGLLAAFRDPTRDPYREFAAEAFGVPVAEVEGEQRSYGKIIVLGAGYGAGGAALCTQASGYGLFPTVEFMDGLRDTYRRLYPEVPQLWDRLEDAARTVVARRAPLGVEVGPLKFELNPRGSCLYLRFPSGKVMRFLEPTIAKDRFGNDAVSVRTKHGDRIIWGGHWLENIAQGIAADLKNAALVRLDRELRPRAHPIMEVHDEIVVEAIADEAPFVLDEIHRIMVDPPAWAPDDLIEAEGSIMLRYSK